MKKTIKNAAGLVHFSKIRSTHQLAIIPATCLSPSTHSSLHSKTTIYTTLQSICVICRLECGIPLHFLASGSLWQTNMGNVENFARLFFFPLSTWQGMIDLIKRFLIAPELSSFPEQKRTERKERKPLPFSMIIIPACAGFFSIFYIYLFP